MTEKKTVSPWKLVLFTGPKVHFRDLDSILYDQPDLSGLQS